MPTIQYKEMRFSADKMKIVSNAIKIINEYRQKGYDLTLRQVYYQFVSRDILPPSWADPKTKSTNNQASYKKLGDVISDARMAGLLDWHSIVDRTREMDGNTHWHSPASIIAAVAQQYQIDKWQDQKYRPEVWVEKDALEGVVGQACRRLDIPFFSCRGYTSMTSIWQNAQRMKKVAVEGCTPVIIHLGDHDPSGIDMSRDIEERTRMFMDDYGDDLEFQRLALNMDQVTQYNPPENPAKSTDTRFEDYRKKHGESSWELDALDPTIIDGLITSAVKKYMKASKFKKMQERENTEKKLLQATSDRWDEVAEFVQS